MNHGVACEIRGFVTHSDSDACLQEQSQIQNKLNQGSKSMSKMLSGNAFKCNSQASECTILVKSTLETLFRFRT